jgi:hypothetical protein
MFLEMPARLKEALLTNLHRFQIFEEWDVYYIYQDFVFL